jgi:hypothetical protein
MFDLDIGRFIAAANTSVVADVPEQVLDIARKDDVIEVRMAVAAASLRPEPRRKFGFLGMKRGGMVREAK